MIATSLEDETLDAPDTTAATPQQHAERLGIPLNHIEEYAALWRQYAPDGSVPPLKAIERRTDFWQSYTVLTTMQSSKQHVQESPQY